MSQEFVTYNGIRMIEGWPELIEAAQLQTTALIGGILYERIKYGEEGDDWGAATEPCHDCKVAKGQFHVFTCDAERCPACRGQALSCDCDYQ